MNTIKDDAANGAFKPVYLLYGPERYLVDHYENLIRSAVTADDMTGLNTDIFTGKEAAYSAVENAVNSLPFMSRRRLVLLRDTGLLSPGRKDDSELMCGLIPRVPESAVLLIVEREADRRMKLYKRIAEHGHVEEFNPPGEGQLVKWVGDICAQSGMKISRAACLELLRTVAPDMNTISAELRKLIAYKGAEAEIGAGDIAQVCVKSAEAKIFALVDAIGQRDTARALAEYANLLRARESPIMILTMIARQYRIVLQCALYAAQGKRADEIAGLTGQRGFVITQALRQARNFTQAGLIQALSDCLEADVSIKTGRIKDALAVELLILRADPS